MHLQSLLAGALSVLKASGKPFSSRDWVSLGASVISLILVAWGWRSGWKGRGLLTPAAAVQRELTAQNPCLDLLKWMGQA